MLEIGAPGYEPSADPEAIAIQIEECWAERNRQEAEPVEIEDRLVLGGVIIPAKGRRDPFRMLDASVGDRAK